MSTKYAFSRFTFVAVAVVSFTLPALASAADWYAGIAAGQSTAEDLKRSDLGSPNFNNNDTSWRLLSGYQFNDHFALELGYQDLGKARWSGSGAFVDVGTKAWDISAVGIVPLGTDWSLLGKVGLANWRIKSSSNFAGSGSDSGSDPVYGVGVNYNVSDKSEVRLEYDVFTDVGNDFLGKNNDVNNLTLGYVMHF